MKHFKKGLIYASSMAFCIGFMEFFYCNSIKKKIPDKLYIYTQDKAVFSMDIPVVGTVYDSSNNICADNIDFGRQVTIQSGDTGQYYVDYKLFGLLPVARTHMEVVDEKYIYSGGFQVGIYLKCNGVYVVNTETICTYDGQNFVPVSGKINKGDYIIKVNDNEVSTKEQLSQAVADSEGKSINITVRRDNQEQSFDVTPVKNVAGEYKLGIWVKDDTQGVGTVTYVCEDGTFAALGHGISDNETGNILDISDGRIYRTRILSIVPGKNGEPGELLGTIDYRENNIGSISKNTDKGIYGENAYSLYSEYSPELMKAAGSYEVTKGAAYVRFYNNGSFHDYEIDITDLKYGDSKNITFKVTSGELLKLTNGIVQGMSGSPIIQNGKIIGAVTHVFVDDSTCGYGIFIDRMLDKDEKETN